MVTESNGNSAVRALLSNLIDYAGLFPPASLTMRDAVNEYARCLASPERWVLGRFVLPAARLQEFYQASADTGPQGAPRIETGIETRIETSTAPVWRLSLLGTPAQAAAAREALPALQPLHAPVAIDSLEVKIASPREIEQKAREVPSGMTAYFEIPLTEELADSVAACAAAGVRAKLRTGGIEASMIPRSEKLARALAACAGAKVPFKATAGLHHPIRSLRKLTYEPDAPSGTMHGFLNVFLAAALLWSGSKESDAVITLRKDRPQAFELAQNEVRWHAYKLSTEQLRAARERFAVSFGSCSFKEPVEDLRSLGWL